MRAGRAGADGQRVRLVTIDDAVGLRLAKDVLSADPKRLPILRANATLTDRYRQSLEAMGLRSIWVHDDLSDGVEPVELLSPDVRQSTARTVSDALHDARRAFSRGERLGEDVLGSLQDVVQRIADSVARNAGASVVLSDLAAADAYTHQHSVDVCALGLLLARTSFLREGWIDDRGQRRFDGLDRRLHLFGLGLLLHDVGKLDVPPAILNKPGALTPEETAIMREHPEAGAQLLSHGTYSPVVRAVVREHHERWDGGGYPRGLTGREIHQLARLAAVADVYDAVTSERPYQPARSERVGYDVILGGAGSAFEPAVVRIFAEVVSPYPVGTEVRLTDGTSGVVVDAERPLAPRVRFPDGERVVDADAELVAA
jgi:HD-GYP domain-containing protein (c-di-GMP phosphodiesterase class II)